MLNALHRPLVMNGGARRQYPVAAKRYTVSSTDEGMSGRQPVDVRERGSRWITDHVEEEKIGDREIIQSSRDGGMPANTVERVAQDHDRTDAGIIEGLDPELIARAK